MLLDSRRRYNEIEVAAEWMGWMDQNNGVAMKQMVTADEQCGAVWSSMEQKQNSAPFSSRLLHSSAPSAHP
jgi:hypothetical protein